MQGVMKLMRSSFTGPVNIGSEEMVSINELAEMVIRISGKSLSIVSVDGPMGVRGRRSDNRLIEQALGWKPHERLINGLEKTYIWIEQQVHRNTHTGRDTGRGSHHDPTKAFRSWSRRFRD